MAGLTSARAWLKGRKTYLVAAAAVLVAVLAWASGEMTTWQLVEATLGALAAMALRAGVAKSGPETTASGAAAANEGTAAKRKGSAPPSAASHGRRTPSGLEE